MIMNVDDFFIPLASFRPSPKFPRITCGSFVSHLCRGTPFEIRCCTGRLLYKKSSQIRIPSNQTAKQLSSVSFLPTCRYQNISSTVKMEAVNSVEYRYPSTKIQGGTPYMFVTS
jgi:predicted metal-binding protein